MIVYASDFIFGRPEPAARPSIPDAKPASKKDEDDDIPVDKEMKPEECKENKEATDQPVRKRVKST